MVASRPAIANANARAQLHCVPGYCLGNTRAWLEIPSFFPTAKASWDGADDRHPGDRTPPRGAPVFWAGGSQGFGHIALHLRDGLIRSTDSPTAGLVSTQSLDWVESHWGLTYLGWAGDLNNVAIPYLADATAWDGGVVYVSRLRRGVHDSESVSRLRYRLDHHASMPPEEIPGPGNDYGLRTVKAVAYWQSQVAPQINGPKDGSYVSNPQANALFGPVYTVIEDS